METNLLKYFIVLQISDQPFLRTCGLSVIVHGYNYVNKIDQLMRKDIHKSNLTVTSHTLTFNQNHNLSLTLTLTLSARPA